MPVRIPVFDKERSTGRHAEITGPDFGGHIEVEGQRSRRAPDRLRKEAAQIRLPFAGARFDAVDLDPFNAEFPLQAAYGIDIPAPVRKVIRGVG